MADETRKLLKNLGFAVTDFEAESKKLEAAATQLTAQSGKEQIAKLLKDATELCRELNTRSLDTAQHIFAIQDRLLARCADAAGRLQAGTDTNEIDVARMEAKE